jgi:hypothetical protein
MAKTISPVGIWKDGKSYQANELSVISINDDLKTAATFYYRLSEAPVEEVDGEGVKTVVSPGGLLADGNVSISGEDYDEWGTASDINLAAYEYVAGKLGLTLA